MGYPVREWNARSGHPEVSWSILIHARTDEPPALDDLRARLTTGPFHVAVAEATDAERLLRVRQAFADRPYRDRQPLVRVALGPSDEIVAAHHSVLDGLGLLALLGLVLDAPVRSSAKGLPPRSGQPASAFGSMSRVGSALISPPVRIARDVRIPARGDHLLNTEVTGWSGGTAELIAGVVATIEAWNLERQGRLRPTEIAVGASLRPGDRLTLTDESAFVRLRVTDWSADAIRETLAAGEPEPPAAAVGPMAIALWPVARLLSRRLGSTVLVSNLGRIDGPEGLRSLSFWPVAHGRSGVAVGAATMGGVATITLRARRSDYGADAAEGLITEIIQRLNAQPRR